MTNPHQEVTTRRVLLAILDGWGEGDGSLKDAIAQTPTPFLDSLKAQYPSSQLQACGEEVGLPQGQMGNSEVGHLNIGAGRVVYQDLVRINRDIASGAIDANPVLNEAFQMAKKNGGSLHFIGLVSDGGVHSLSEHLYHLVQMASAKGVERVYIHALTDGRDTDPNSGLGYLQELTERISGGKATIASVVGRYYAMDRDKRWERIKVAYDALISGIGQPTQNVLEGVKASYREGITDEFIKPLVLTHPDTGKAIGRIAPNDVVMCFNFRTDRLRELTVALTQRDMPEHGMHTLPLHYVTMTRYDEQFQGVNVVYEKDNLEDTLGEVISKAGGKQLRIAETEKYAHVTFFFSGGREEPFQGEERILIHSPKVATYDLQPQMSAPEVATALCQAIEEQMPHFICLNFANGDMVGHTGVYPAIQEAVRTVDSCLKKVVNCALKHQYEVLIIADHGNADYARNEDGTPNTAHSLNPVPCILVSNRYSRLSNGRLADVAPTVLTLLGLPQPPLMTGKTLCQ